MGVGAIEIGGGAEHDDAAEVGEVVNGAAQQGLEGGVVFLRGGAVGAAAVGEEFRRVFEGFAEQGAAEVDVRGGEVAGDDGGGLGAGGVGGGGGVVGAVGDGGGGVVEGGGAGEGDGEGLEGARELEDFGAVDGGGVLGGGEGAEGDVAMIRVRKGVGFGGGWGMEGALPRGEVIRDFPSIEFVLQSYLDRVTSEGDGSEGCDLGAYARDAGDHEVGLSKVEEGREGQGGDTGGSVDFYRADVSFSGSPSLV